MANINKIRLSGQTYDIQDPNASKTVELTQAQYDALAVKDPNTFYIITDATAGDLSNYYTKSETSGATQISTALASKQTTLTAGTGISIVDNVISAEGGGGVTVDSAFSRTSENPVQNKVISNNATNGDGAVTNTGGRYQWMFYSVGGVGTKKGFYLDTINGETVVKQYANTRSLQLVETSAITTSMSSSSTDSQVPSAKAVYDQLGGLKLVKLTQSEYDALTTKDDNTVYFIGDSTNGYTMKIGSANVN